MNDKSAEAALSEAIAALSECDEYFDNRADADCDQDGFIPNKEMRLLSVVRTALRALENGPAGLADATTNPPLSDLSSLRKGAEVAVKPLEWDLSGMARGYPAKAVSIFGNYTAWEIEDGFWMPPEAHCGRRAGVGLQSALDAAQIDFETRIRSALVSDSREDGE